MNHIYNSYQVKNNYMCNQPIVSDDVPDDYIDDLPYDLTDLCIHFKKIRFSMNLLKFDNLIVLSIAGCKMKTFPELPNSIKYLTLINLNLNHLPNLENTNLIMIECSFNNLILLPKFPNTLIDLTCEKNKLIEVLDLPHSVRTINLRHNNLKHINYFPNESKFIYLSFNNLKSLPTIPKNVVELSCSDNKLISMPEIKSNITFLNFECEVFGIYKGNNPENYKIINQINTINQFKSTYYHLLCKKKLRKWLWKRVREPKIQRMYHPDNLKKILDNIENCNLEEILDDWCK
jgi:hypothetical protein